MPSARARRWTRVALAGPVSLLAAFVIMLGMATWLPKGAAGVDNIVLPLFLLPLIWAALFFHACLDRRLARVALIVLALAGASAGMIAWSFTHHPRAAPEHRP